MKKLCMLIALLFAEVLAFNGVCFAWGSASGDGSNYRQLQETAVFFNNGGNRLTHGEAVVLDLNGTGVTAGTTLGAYVEDLATADSILVVGCVKYAADNQTPVVVVTKGPIDALAADSSDAVSSGTAVGTTASGTIGSIGGGTNLGIALEAGSGSDDDYLFIWVDPTGAD
ncbi:MAG: hypothetical protein QME16_00135 [Planctomycetota bacterium]|nr:hypothetical protein [Planctomycetota bacterium]